MFDHAFYANQGKPRAFTMIGYFMESYPAYKRLARSVEHIYWYKLGARLGDYMAAYNLGQCYEAGRGVKADMKQAVFWWKKATKAGCAKAMTNLATAYYNGEGVRRNRKKALKLFGEASLAGDKLARKSLNKLKWF